MAVGVSNFPGSLDTAVELIQPANNALTTLDGNLTINAVTIVVQSTAAFSTSGLIMVGSEIISYTGKTSTSFTGCVRGFNGSTATTHTTGTTVEDVIVGAHHSVLSSALIATQTKVGSGASTPTANTVLRGTGAGTSAFGAIVNADIDPAAGIPYSKLSLTGAIVNADVSSTAAIAYSKLAALTANRLLVSSAGGAVSASTLTWNATDSAVGALKAIDFTGVTTAVTPLRLQFNTDLVTAELGLNANVSLPIGQAEMIQVKRSTNDGLAKGKVVYVVGSDGANKTVGYALATSAITGDTTLGMMTETVNGGSKGFCVTSGLVSGLTTTGLTEGTPVYLSATSAGDLVSTAPAPPNHRIQVGYCVKEHASQGVIYVNIRTAYELGELCDVSAAAPIAAGSLLIRNATTGVWAKGTLTAGTGISITNGDGAITINSTGVAAGSTGDYQINSSNAFAAGVLSQSSGRLTSTATAVSSGVTPYLRLITPADTGLTASTEAPGIVFGGDASGATVTRTRAAGATTTQREYLFTAPTYAAASATTITTAATVAITGAPIAGSNVTLTNSFGLYIATDSSATLPSSLALQNANASGYSGISFRNNSGTTRSSIAYVPTGGAGTPDYLLITIPASGGGDSTKRAFTLGCSSGNAFNVNSDGQINVCSNVTRWDLTAKCTIQNDVANQIPLTVLHGDSTPTVNAIQVRDREERVRYGLFINPTETRSRLLDNDAGQQNRAMLTELVTLSTVGATTDTTMQIPANSLVLGVTVRVTTGITGIDSTALQIGDATTAARFGSIAAFTAGTTGVGLNHLQGGISTDAAGPIVTSATAVRLTLSGGTDNTPSAGAVRVTIHYISLTAPTS